MKNISSPLKTKRILKTFVSLFVLQAALYCSHASYGIGPNEEVEKCVKETESYRFTSSLSSRGKEIFLTRKIEDAIATHLETLKIRDGLTNLGGHQSKGGEKYKDAIRAIGVLLDEESLDDVSFRKKMKKYATRDNMLYMLSPDNGMLGDANKARREAAGYLARLLGGESLADKKNLIDVMLKFLEKEVPLFHITLPHLEVYEAATTAAVHVEEDSLNAVIYLAKLGIAYSENLELSLREMRKECGDWKFVTQEYFRYFHHFSTVRENRELRDLHVQLAIMRAQPNLRMRSLFMELKKVHGSFKHITSHHIKAFEALEQRENSMSPIHVSEVIRYADALGKNLEKEPQILNLIRLRLDPSASSIEALSRLESGLVRSNPQIPQHPQSLSFQQRDVNEVAYILHYAEAIEKRNFREEFAILNLLRLGVEVPNKSFIDAWVRLVEENDDDMDKIEQEFLRDLNAFSGHPRVRNSDRKGWTAKESVNAYHFSGTSGDTKRENRTEKVLVHKLSQMSPIWSEIIRRIQELNIPSLPLTLNAMISLRDMATDNKGNFVSANNVTSDHVQNYLQHHIRFKDTLPNRRLAEMTVGAIKHLASLGLPGEKGYVWAVEGLRHSDRFDRDATVAPWENITPDLIEALYAFMYLDSRHLFAEGGKDSYGKRVLEHLQFLNLSPEKDNITAVLELRRMPLNDEEMVPVPWKRITREAITDYRKSLMTKERVAKSLADQFVLHQLALHGLPPEKGFMRAVDLVSSEMKVNKGMSEKEVNANITRSSIEYKVRSRRFDAQHRHVGEASTSSQSQDSIRSAGRTYTQGSARLYSPEEAQSEFFQDMAAKAKLRTVPYTLQDMQSVIESNFPLKAQRRHTVERLLIGDLNAFKLNNRVILTPAHMGESAENSIEAVVNRLEEFFKGSHPDVKEILIPCDLGHWVVLKIDLTEPSDIEVEYIDSLRDDWEAITRAKKKYVEKILLPLTDFLALRYEGRPVLTRVQEARLHMDPVECGPLVATNIVDLFKGKEIAVEGQMDNTPSTHILRAHQHALLKASGFKLDMEKYIDGAASGQLTSE